MSSSSVERIHEIANKLHESGVKPTLAAVREKLGGGSFTTISEAMKSWRAQVQEEHELALVQVPAALDERMEQLKRAAWEVAQQEAENRLKSEREALAVQRQELDAQLAEAHQVVEVLEREAEARDLAITEFKSERAELEEVLTKTTFEAEQLVKEVSKLKEKQAKDEVELAELNEKNRSQAQKISDLEKSLETYMKMREASEEKYEKALVETNVARADLADREADIRVLKDKLETLMQEKAEFRELENRLRLENQTQASQLARAETYEGLFAEEQTKREALDKELAELRAVLSVEQEKRERLEQELAKLAGNNDG